MKKYLLLVTIIALTIFSNKAKAQYYNNTYREDSWHVTIGPDLLAIVNPQQLSSQIVNPKGGNAYATYSRVGFGASVHAEYYPNPFVGLTLGTGITYIPKKGNNAKISDYTLVPFRIGAKAFFSNTMYLGAEAGLGYANPAYKGSHMAKLVSPQIGYSNNDTGWDINLRYEVDHQKDTYISMLGLHIAYSFDLSN